MEEQLTHLESLELQNLKSLYQWEVVLIQIQDFPFLALQCSFQPQ